MGVYFCEGYKIISNRCTQSIIAKVTENKETIKEERARTRSDGFIYHNSIKVYTSIFEYEYDGKTYVTEGAESSYFPDFKVGEEVEIRINPSDPYEFCMPNENYSDFKGLVIIGVVFLIIGIRTLIKSK